MSTLELTPLGKVANVISGYAFKSESFSDDGVPVIKIANIKNGQVVFGQGEKEFLPREFLQTTGKKFHVLKGDVLVSLTGSHITQPNSVVGRVARYTETFTSLLNQRAGKLVIQPEVDANLGFLYYLLSTRVAREEIAMLAHGAANQANVSPKDIEKLKFYFPPNKEQKKIAAVLSAYDDLIENNKRRIALLEKMAEEIYREWFVRLRFPGHEKVKVVKGVPEGWRETELTDVAEINSRSIKKGNEPDWIEYLDISAVTTNKMGATVKVKYAEAPGRARRQVRYGDVIWSSVRPGNRAYCLVMNPPANLVVSTGFAVISPRRRVPFTYIYRVVTTDSFVEQMVSVAKGAAYPATSFDDFGKAKILLPTSYLLQEYHKICEPLLVAANNYHMQCDMLLKTRDMLLPRLISGKLSVENLDIQFPPGMEA